MNEQTSSNTPSGDEKHEIVLDLGYEVCDSIPMSGNQLISELQGKVAYHERELAIWKAALESALRSEGKRKSSPSPHGEMKVSASVEMSPSPYIIGVIRANEHAAGGDTLDLTHALRPIFENIATAKVSTSAEDARALRYLRPSDPISMNRDRQIADAKQTALAMVRAGYRPPAPAEIRILGEEFYALAKLAIHGMVRGEFATEFDGFAKSFKITKAK